MSDEPIINIVKYTLEIKNYRFVEVRSNTKRLIIFIDRIKHCRLPHSCCEKKQKIQERFKERCWRRAPFLSVS
jgi:hypothetical protein